MYALSWNIAVGIRESLPATNQNRVLRYQTAPENSRQKWKFLSSKVENGVQSKIHVLVHLLHENGMFCISWLLKKHNFDKKKFYWVSHFQFKKI